MQKIFKPKEAAEYLTLSMSMFRKLVKAGKIKTINVSEKRLGVYESELVNYLESLK